jgi:hypothetical protein
VDSHQKPLDEHKPLSTSSSDFGKLATTLSDGSWQFAFIGFSSFGYNDDILVLIYIYSEPK